MSPARSSTTGSASEKQEPSATARETKPRKRRQQARAVETRDQIISTAIHCFSSFGFEGATTRLIAERAGVNQGLITHHFNSKEELWKAAVDRLFQNMEDDFVQRIDAWRDADRPTRIRLMIRHFVRFASRHPEQLRFMMQEGMNPGPRMQWLVKTHLSFGYPRFCQMLADARAEGMLVDGDDPHLFYAFVGATSTIFALASECEELTGMDPGLEKNVEAHAQLIESMLLRVEKR